MTNKIKFAKCRFNQLCACVQNEKKGREYLYQKPFMITTVAAMAFLFILFERQNPEYKITKKE